MNQNNILRKIPAVDRLLQNHPQWLRTNDRQTVVACLRQTTTQLRKELCAGIVAEAAIEEWIVQKMRELLSQQERFLLCPLINATGIVLHTNLGRALLPSTAVTALTRVARQYSNIELDLEQGGRGIRYQHVRDLLCEVTGAEDALVVNNNAAAVLLTLSTLATGRQVIVSRGQLVEIGGSFRIPDVMQQSGAALVEVGATNKTHRYDYERAINDQTAVIMKVHTSNYQIIGFNGQVTLPELAEIAHMHQVALVEDLGSGLLVDLSAWGIDEPTVQNSIKQGTDLVLFSGDKLMGSAQCGIIVGKRQYIDKMKSHPLLRAVRIDKLTLAALQATLRIYHSNDRVSERIPVLRMITQSMPELRQKADYLCAQLRSSGVPATIHNTHSYVGGGTLPGCKLETVAVVLPAAQQGAEILQRRLRQGKPPVLTRIEQNQVWMDVRTIQNDELDEVVAGCIAASGEEG